MATWEERLDATATEAEAATTKAETAAQIFYDVANGDSLSTVTTLNGEVRTVAKFIADNEVRFDAAIDDALTSAEEAITEQHILASDTDTITLTGFTNAGVAVYVEGSREFNITKSGDYDIIFDSVLPTGTVIWAVKRNLEGAFDISGVSIANSGGDLTQALDVWLNDLYTLAPVDILPSYTGNALKSLMLNAAGDTVEWSNPLRGNAAANINMSGFALNIRWNTKTAAYTAVAGDRLLADTSAGVFTITLPASPVSGDEVWFADPGSSWGNNSLTVSGNGNNIDGAASFTANVNEGYFSTVYTGTTWEIRFTGGTI